MHFGITYKLFIISILKALLILQSDLALICAI